jgi:cytochrome c oxidase cbb3-type subunit 3
MPEDQALQRVPLGAPPGGPPSPALSISNPFEGDRVAVEQGKSLFSAMNCVYCHGSGASGLMGPALNGRGWRYGGSPAEIYNSIHDGRPKGMPAWGASLPPDQIWKLVAYLESLGGATAPAKPPKPGLAGAQPSSTGDQVAGQVQTDTANQARIEDNQRPGESQ